RPFLRIVADRSGTAPVCGGRNLYARRRSRRRVQPGWKRVLFRKAQPHNDVPAHRLTVCVALARRKMDDAGSAAILRKIPGLPAEALPRWANDVFFVFASSTRNEGA